MKLNKDDYERWKSDPVTVTVFEFWKKQRSELIESYADQFEAGIFPNHKDFHRDTAACEILLEVINLNFEDLENDQTSMGQVSS